MRYAAALVSAALLVAGCGDSKRGSKSDGVADAATTTATPTPTATPSDAEQLQNLLKERARRIQNGDPQALVQTSTGPQAIRDKREANAARALKLEGVALESRAASIQGRYATAHVLTRYHFLGIDDSEFAVRSAMSFTKTPDGWRVKDDHPSQGVVAPWQLTNYIVRRSPHFVTLAPVGLKLDNFMKDLEAGRLTTKRGLPGVKVPDKLLVLLARNTKDAKALARDEKSLGSIYAIAQASVQQTGSAQRVFRVSAQRMLVMWRWLRRSSTAERRMTIAHEMTHAALIKQTSGRMPAWLVEGTAMYVSKDRRYSQAGALLSGGVLRDSSQQAPSKRVLSLTALGKPTSMDNLAVTPLGFAYSYASAAAYAIAQEHGRKGLLRLYQAFDKQKFKGTPGRKLMDRVMRATLHESFASVQQDVDAFARAHAKFG